MPQAHTTLLGVETKVDHVKALRYERLCSNGEVTIMNVVLREPTGEDAAELGRIVFDAFDAFDAFGAIAE
jgi:hypothetical protein